MESAVLRFQRLRYKTNIPPQLFLVSQLTEHQTNVESRETVVPFSEFAISAFDIHVVFAANNCEYRTRVAIYGYHFFVTFIGEPSNSTVRNGRPFRQRRRGLPDVGHGAGTKGRYLNRKLARVLPFFASWIDAIREKTKTSVRYEFCRPPGPSPVLDERSFRREQLEAWIEA